MFQWGKNDPISIMKNDSIGIQFDFGLDFNLSVGDVFIFFNSKLLTFWIRFFSLVKQFFIQWHWQYIFVYYSPGPYIKYITDFG